MKQINFSDSLSRRPAPRSILKDDTCPLKEKEKAISDLERLFDESFTVAAHQRGKVWRNGLCGLPDESRAAEWFLRSAKAGNDYSQYALGKLLHHMSRAFQETPLPASLGIRIDSKRRKARWPSG